MSSSTPITIVDYGMGNLHSVRRQLEQLGARVCVSAAPAEIARADKLLLPGVGHFATAMQRLRERQLVESLEEAARHRAVPTLGICLGMQLMAQRSEEGEATGLGWIDADVVRFKVSDPIRYKVPHVGWNLLHARRPSVLLREHAPDAELYFVHAYHLRCRSEDCVVAETEYAYRFPSVIEAGNLFGAQPHPEKSHEAGRVLLRNFIEL